MSRVRLAPRMQMRRVGAPSGPRQADAKRAALLNAAETLFLERGVETCTMDDVASRAGVVKGTLYHYFAGKSALIEALSARYSDVFHARVMAVIDKSPPSDWGARLHGWIAGAMSAYLETVALHDVLFHSAGMPSRVPLAGDKVVVVLSNILEAGHAAGAWTVESPQDTATVMFYGLHGAADEALLANRDSAEVVQFLTNLYSGMLRIARPDHARRAFP